MNARWHKYILALLVLCPSSLVLAREIQGEAKQVNGSTNMQTINLSGDTLFKFGEDKLSPAGTKALDDLLRKGMLMPLTRYRIEGHTDNIGDAKANYQLSQRRADAVKTYLMGKDRNLQLETGGIGDRKPLVQCSEKLAKPALVKCLAPNRRVSIEQIYN